jgi:hypothetical protein
MPSKSEASPGLLRSLVFVVGGLITAIIGLFAILIDLISSAYWNSKAAKNAEQAALRDKHIMDGPFGSTEDLYAKALALTGSAALPTADQFMDSFISRYNTEAQSSGKFLTFSLRLALVHTAAKLYSDEHFEHPPYHHEVITTLIEAGRYRDELIAYIKKLRDAPKAFQIFSRCVIASASNLAHSAPPIALQDFTGPDVDPDTSICVPLSETILNLAPTIDKVLAPFFEADATDIDLFKDLRSVLTKNRAAYDASKPSEREPLALVRGTELERLFVAKVPFVLPEETRYAGHWCIAPPGRGKTTLLHAMIKEDLDRDAAVVLIDSKGDLIEPIKTLASIKHRLLLIEPNADAALALNPLDIAHTSVVHAVSLIEYIMAGLLDAKFTALQSTLFRNVVPAIIEAIPNPTLDTFKDVMVRGLPSLDKLNPHARQFFENNQTGFNSKTYESTRKEVVWRLDYLLTNPVLRSMFSASHTRLDLGKEMDDGKVIIINNSKAILGDEGAEFFGRFFVALIARAAQQRSGRPGSTKKPCFVYIDECQSVIAKDTRIPVLLDECRSQKIALILAHQRTAQLTPPVLDAVANCAIRMANSDDEAKYLSSKLRMDTEVLQALPRGTFGTFVRDLTPRGIQLAVSKVDFHSLPNMTAAEMSAIRDRMKKDFSASPRTEPPGAASPAAATAPTESLPTTGQALESAAPDPAAPHDPGEPAHRW